MQSICGKEKNDIQYMTIYDDCFYAKYQNLIMFKMDFKFRMSMRIYKGILLKFLYLFI